MNEVSLDPTYFMKPVSFEEIISFESLLEAHKRARLCKQHKKEVIEFELNLSANLWALHYELKYQHYKIGEYRKFMIYDPKEREIQAIPYRDRVVQHAVCDRLLIPLLENHLIDANCACRVGKGTDYAIKLLRKFMTRHYKKYGKKGYFVKLDIKKYFPSINHDVLYKKLEKFNFDKNTMWLLHTIIDSYGNGTGLPMGNQSSQCFALLYLDRIDRLIKEKYRIKKYVRYMDDMLLLVESKEKAKFLLEEIGKEVLKEKIQLNPKSTVISVKNGIEFLGWRFSFGKNGKVIQKVKNASKKRMFEKMKYNLFLVRHGKKPLDSLENSQASYKGHLRRGNGWKIYIKIHRACKMPVLCL